MLDEIASMRSGGPTDEELDAAKGNLIGGYGLQARDRRATWRDALLTAELDGLDAKCGREVSRSA